MLIHPRAVACALAFTATHTCAAGVADPVVVVAGARIDQRREDTAATVVVGRDELLRHGDRSLVDALKRVPGITIGTPTARDSGIRLRGLGNGYTQILINGVAAPNGFSFEALAPELIERIEIVRSATAELGTQAIAGTINIVMRKATSAAQSTLKLGLDAQRGAWSPSLIGEAGGKGDRVSFAVPVTLLRSRVGTRQEEDERAPGLHRIALQSEMNAATSLTLAPRASMTLDDGDKVSLRGLVSAGRRGIDLSASETALAGPASRYPQRGSLFESSALSMRADALWSRQLAGGGQVEAKAGGDASRRESDFEYGATDAGVRRPGVHFVHADFRDTGYYGGTTYTATARAGHTLSAGWDGAHARRMQTRLGREFDVPGVDMAVRDDRYTGTIDRLGLFVQDAWEISPQWSLSAGWRGEVLVTTVADAHAARVRQRSVVGSPLLQALRKFGKGGQLRVGLARTYKAPTMQTLIPRRYTVDNNNSATNPDNQGNAALKPEKAWGLDAGYDYYPARDSLLSVSAYARRIDDVTVDRLFLDGASWVITPDNQGRAMARGVALEAKLPLPGAPSFLFNANLARNWSRVRRIAGPDNRLDEQVPLSANVGVEYRGGVRAGMNLTYARGAVTRLSDVWTSWSDGARALDVYALWGSGSGMRVRLAASNLLERTSLSGARYESAAGARETVFRTSTGAVVRLTVEVDLKK